MNIPHWSTTPSRIGHWVSLHKLWTSTFHIRVMTSNTVRQGCKSQWTCKADGINPHTFLQKHHFFISDYGKRNICSFSHTDNVHVSDHTRKNFCPTNHINIHVNNFTIVASLRCWVIFDNIFLIWSKYTPKVPPSVPIWNVDIQFGTDSFIAQTKQHKAIDQYKNLHCSCFGKRQEGKIRSCATSSFICKTRSNADNWSSNGSYELM